MSRLTYRRETLLRHIPVGRWVVIEVIGAVGGELVYTIDQPHEDLMHDSFTFAVRGRWLRYNRDAAPGTPDYDDTVFTYDPTNTSHDIGWRLAGNWGHRILDADFLAYHVKMVKPIAFDLTRDTHHPRENRINVDGQHTLHVGTLGITVTDGLSVNGTPVPAGKIIYPRHYDANIEGVGVLERFH